LSAKQSGDRGRRTAIRYIDHVDSSHHLEQLADDMGRTPVAVRRHVDLTRIGLGIGNELGNCLGRNGWMHRRNIRHASNACNRRDVANEIEI
jgi:hypothetical protein